ncbi:hypothetical protein LTR37_010152 [Vermiconidia calcicola]|uniref:Uncharacterized protein n=1 Tax=Vermiconidia calcicola TaxID=1690605 RepID=A0ACC3N638_9PEZI|nr:hypothetical protein LTR37_010152 [Vermiconidia calcicola]
MSGQDKVLVYQHRPKGEPVVKKGLEAITKDKLHTILSNNSSTLQSTTKPLSRTATQIDIYQRDLLTPEQKAAYGSKPNSDSNVAGVTVPIKALLENFVAGAFPELTILSEKRGSVD